MTSREFVEQFHGVLDQYLANETGGEEFVRLVDDLMADRLPDEMPDMIFDLLDEFHDDVALYVDDQETRKEHPAYYGPEELLDKAKDCRARLLTIKF